MDQVELYCLLNLLDILQEHKTQSTTKAFNDTIEEVCNTIKVNIKNKTIEG